MSRPADSAWNPRRLAPALLAMVVLEVGCSDTGGGGGPATPPPAAAPTTDTPPVAKEKATQPGGAGYSGKGPAGAGGAGR